MQWFVGLGDELPEDTPRTISFNLVSYFKKHDHRAISSYLVGCEERRAPMGFADDCEFPNGAFRRPRYRPTVLTKFELMSQPQKSSVKSEAT